MRGHGTTGFVVHHRPTSRWCSSRDPDQAWAEIGPYFLHEATTYAGWQTPDIKSSVHSHATTVDELRAEGIYAILTPEQCLERAARAATTA